MKVKGHNLAMVMFEQNMEYNLFCTFKVFESMLYVMRLCENQAYLHKLQVLRNQCFS